MSEKRVSCSFCNEEHPSSAIGEHLMLCGNKTDQCPNCEKYIRRAIFAYHYENNCANLDESEPEVKAAPKQSQIPSTFQPNYSPPSSSRPSARNDTNTTTKVVDLATLPNPQTVTTSQQSNSGPVTYIACPYCNYYFDPLDSGIHQEKCPRNPKNMANKHQPQNNPTSNQNTVRLNYVDQSNDNIDVLCQYCNKIIRGRDYHNHTQVCVQQYYQPTIQQPQCTYRVDAPATARCRYCDHHFRIDFVQSHERICKQNPLNTSLEAQLRAVYYPPPLYTTQYYYSN